MGSVIDLPKVGEQSEPSPGDEEFLYRGFRGDYTAQIAMAMEIESRLKWPRKQPSQFGTGPPRSKPDVNPFPYTRPRDRYYRLMGTYTPKNGVSTSKVKFKVKFDMEDIDGAYEDGGDTLLCSMIGHYGCAMYEDIQTNYEQIYGPADELNVSTRDDLKKKALERYETAKMGGPERLVSGSDDFTLFMWHPEIDKKPVTRMTGHQQLINDVRFSPDTRLLASASFDKSVKLWDGKTGTFLTTLRGHVSRVYQIAWSADSRLLCSGSSDSTLKVWDLKTKKLLFDLPGHADEVYAVDWSPDGQRVVSGGKDKVLKIWRQ